MLLTFLTSPLVSGVSFSCRIVSSTLLIRDTQSVQHNKLLRRRFISLLLHLEKWQLKCQYYMSRYNSAVMPHSAVGEMIVKLFKQTIHNRSPAYKRHSNSASNWSSTFNFTPAIISYQPGTAFFSPKGGVTNTSMLNAWLFSHEAPQKREWNYTTV